MARVLGVELVTLLVLGFVIGMLSFMLWNIKRELLALQGDNESLSKRMLGLASETSTFRYKKTLVESDLEKLRRDMAAKEEQVTGLTGQLAALKVQVAEAATHLEAEKKKFSHYSSEKEEMQGIQDRLLSDIEGCRKSLKKCEDAKGASAKVANVNCTKKTKLMEDTNKGLTTKLEAADERILQLLKQAQKCIQPIVS